MLYADLPEICAIENESFSTPWSMNSFDHELMEPHSILKIAELNGHIVGYICLRVMLDITHILNLAVAPPWRRMGIGSMLLETALDELEAMQEETDFITLEVRASSHAIMLYEKHGFRVIGRRKNYYHKPQEDAVLMGMEIGGNGDEMV